MYITIKFRGRLCAHAILLTSDSKIDDFFSPSKTDSKIIERKNIVLDQAR